MADLFGHSKPYEPLASRVRPSNLAQIVGQQHLLAEGRPLRVLLDAGQIHSMLLWGPPGVGKTTLARVIAASGEHQLLTLSAVTAGVKEIRAAVAQAQQVAVQSGRKSILFIDEVHRFNKSQQDAFLPFVEDGTLILIGATTENPSFELNNALLSRCKVYVLTALTDDDIGLLLAHACEREALTVKLSSELSRAVVAAADGDGRRALNLLEMAQDLADDRGELSSEQIQHLVSGGARRFDNRGDQFYEQISAMHKSMRGSHPDAALYWLCRMLDGGCDPLYVARRVLRMASEDVGLADPRALELCLTAWQTYERLGSPEGELAIAQAIVYLSVAPKSNALYSAYNGAMAQVRSSPSYPVPEHLRNAPTQLMKDMGYGADYRYAHNEADAYAAGERYLPDELVGTRFFEPTERGFESRIQERLAYWRSLDAQAERDLSSGAASS